MPDCATWWFDHVAETYMYVAATRQGDAAMQASAVEKLVEGTASWGTLLRIPDAGKLMLDHVSGVKNLVDAAFGGNVNAIQPTIEAVLANVVQQTELYLRTIPNFPAEDWAKLFTTHITATGGYILALSGGDAEDFKKNYNNVILNRNALARFWGLLCMKLRQR